MENLLLSEERSKDWGLEGVRQLMCGKILYSNLYFSTIDPKYFAELLQSFILSQSPLSKQNTQLVLRPDRFRWFCHCFASYYQIPNKSDSFLLIKNRFITSDLNSIHEIRGFLRNPNIKTDIELKFNLAKSLFVLIQDSRPFSIWLLPMLKAIYEPIDTFTLYKRLHFNMFCLFEDMSHFTESDISKIDFDYTEAQPYEMLFQIPQVYTNTKILNIIERYIFNKYHFPIPTKFAGSGVFISLVNTTLSSNQHFIDVFQKHITSLYNNGDFQNFKKFSGYFGTFQPWFFASVFHDKCPTLPYYFQKPDFKYENIATEFINRLYNDRQLFQTVRELTGTTNSCIEFLNHSVPYLFFHSIRINISIFTEPLQMLQNIKFYIISDEARDIDFDFCYCYFVLYKIIENLNITGKDEGFLYNEIVTQNEVYIKSITSNEVKNLLFRDLLSLIFIQNEEGQFICPFNTGFLIIKLLLEMNEDQDFMPYVKSGYQRFNLVYCLNMNQTIESAIRPNKYQLLEALLKDDDDIAKYLACLSDSNEQLFELTKNVKNYSHSKESFNINQSVESTVKEIALAFDDKIALRYALNFDTSDVEHELYSRRLNETHHFLKLHNYPVISRQMSYFDTNEWEKQEIKEDLPLLKSFYNRLESFIPISLQIKFAKTVKEVLLMNPSNTIINLLQSNEMEKSEEIAKKLNIDIHSLVFSGDYSEDVYFYFEGESPVVAYASIISNDHFMNSHTRRINSKSIEKIIYESDDDKENIKIKFIRNRLLNSKQKIKISSDVSFSNLNEEVDFYDEFIQEGMDNDDLLDFLDELFEMYPKEKDLILDIRYHVDEKEFEQRILEHLDKENLVKVRDLFNDCIIDTEKYDFLISLDVEQFPLESCFRELINNKEYEKARKLYDYFKDSSDLDQIINEMEKDLIQHRKHIDPILTYFPFIKERILSSFPFSQVSEFDTDFQRFLSSIPEDWETNTEPNELVSNHITEYGIVRDLVQEFSFLNIDEAIIKLIDKNIIQNKSLSAAVQILQLVESIDFFIIDIRNQKKFIEFILKSICEILSKLETSLNNEQIYKVTLFRKSIISLKNDEYISTNYQSIINKIDSIYQILHRQLFNKFQQKITFNDFEKVEAGRHFAEISLKYDDFELLKTVCNAWDLDFNCYLDRKIIYPYQLSIYDNEHILNYSEIENKEQIASREKLSNDITNILSHALFYDPDFVQQFTDISLPIENLFDYLSYSSKEKTEKPVLKKKRSKTTFIKKPNKLRRNTVVKPEQQQQQQPPLEGIFKFNCYERLKKIIEEKNISSKCQRVHLDDFLKEVSSPTNAISYYVSKCKLAQAVEILNDIDDVEVKTDLFKNALFKEAVYFDEIGRLRNSLRITPDYAKPYLRSLLDFATKSDLLNLKLTVAQFLNLHDAAAETAIDLYKGQIGNFQNLAFLDIAQIEIALELRIRKQGKNEEHIISTEKLIDLVKKIDLQRKYNMFLCERQLQNSSFSAFSTGESQESMVFLLFKEKYFELAFEFVYEFQIPMNIIGERLIDILISDSDQTLVNYILLLEENSSQNFFKEILYSMMNRIVFVFRNYKVASQIIHNAISDKLFKCSLMIQFNMIEDAAEIALKNDFYDFVPVIANQAYLSQKKEIVQKCLKYLENTPYQPDSSIYS